MGDTIMKEFKTVAELEASKQTVSDLMLYCRENNLYYIVQDAGYTPTGDDVTFTNGRVGKAVFIADAKYIRTTSGNVQDELDSIVAGGLPSQSGNQFKFLSTDGTNAQWSNGQVEVATFAELEALEPTAEGMAFICQERLDTRYILKPISYVALPGDATFANGRVGELQVGDKADVREFGATTASVDNAPFVMDALSRCLHVVVPVDIPLGQPVVMDEAGRTISGEGGFSYVTSGWSDRDGMINVRADNCTVRDIYLDAEGSISTGRNIRLDECDNTVIDNVTGRGAPQCFVVIHDNVTNTFVRNCRSYRGYGILVDDAQGSSGLFTSNNVFDGSDLNGDGIEVNCPTYGFSKVRSYNDSAKNYTGVAINQGLGIGLEVCDDFIITGFECENLENDGLHFEDGANNGVVTGFKLKNVNTNGAVGSGGILIKDCDNLEIGCGLIENAQQQHGIAIFQPTGTSSNISLHDIEIRGCGKSGVRSWGTENSKFKNITVIDANQLNGGYYGIQTVNSNTNIEIEGITVVDGAFPVRDSVRLEPGSVTGGYVNNINTDLTLNGGINDQGGNVYENRGSSKSIAELNADNLALAYEKLTTGGSLVIACVGDSMTAGHDVTSPDVIPSPYGNPNTIAPVQYPSALVDALNLYTGVTHTFVNRGYSGDTAKQSYERWTANPSADVAHLMFGINDAAGAYGATFDEYVKYMRLLVQKHVLWGCGVVIHTATQQQYNVENRLATKYTKAIEKVARDYNCPIFYSETAVKYTSFDGVYSDFTHFNAHGYHKYGNAVASFVLSGGWTGKIESVSSEQTLFTGDGAGKAGFFSVGVGLTGASSSNLLTLQTGGIQQQGDIVSYSFYMDCDLMHAYAIGAISNTTVTVSSVLAPTFVGDDRGERAVNRLGIKSYQNREIKETTSYIVQPSRNLAASGKLAYIATLYGRGWKTISVKADSLLASQAFLNALMLKEKGVFDFYSNVSTTSGEYTSSGEQESVIYQYPYYGEADDSSVLPSAAPLPSVVNIACPSSILPYKAINGNFNDSLPIEVLIANSRANEWAKVILRRVSSNNELEVSVIAQGSAGAALIPTAARIKSAVFDTATETLGAIDQDSIVGSLNNMYLQFNFGVTPNSYYNITATGVKKTGEASWL